MLSPVHGSPLGISVLDLATERSPHGDFTGFGKSTFGVEPIRVSVEWPPHGGFFQALLVGGPARRMLAAHFRPRSQGAMCIKAAQNSTGVCVDIQTISS